MITCAHTSRHARVHAHACSRRPSPRLLAHLGWNAATGLMVVRLPSTRDRRVRPDDASMTSMGCSAWPPYSSLMYLRVGVTPNEVSDPFG
jgi:hypothetical protein